MKRERLESIELETDSDTKKTRQDEYQGYLRTRSRDNSQAVEITNPKRHLHAIFDLAYFLHLSKDARENSWIYFNVIKQYQTVEPNVFEI